MTQALFSLLSVLVVVPVPNMHCEHARLGYFELTVLLSYIQVSVIFDAGAIMTLCTTTHKCDMYIQNT